MHLERKPLAKKTAYNLDFFKQYQHLSKHEEYHAFLESGRGGRYSIAGLKPAAIVRGKDSVLNIQVKDSAEERKGNLLDVFRDWFSAYKSVKDEELPDFQGGAIGFFSYDCVRYFEKLDRHSEDDLETPDLFFLLFDDLAVYDHQKHEIWFITHYPADNEVEEAKKRLAVMEHRWTEEHTEPFIHKPAAEPGADALKGAFTKESFMEAVEKIKEYIESGDVFQVNLSVRQTQPLGVHPLKVYETLRELNPSPYMAYLELKDFQIVSGSPELLVKIDGEKASTRPIAGTRSRGENEEEDKKLANELIENEKERAEHVMLVDLERNDLGRVCKYGTVEVNEFMVIEKYSHVMHIVSNVQGTLAEGKDYIDVFKGVFPGGTITGAPKIRTMEIIEGLEPSRRGIYTGSIGWIGYNGDMELNIVIRTLLAKDGHAYIQSGAGIVIDSNPKHEYKESLKKAQALLRAKELSEEENMTAEVRER
ncbi:anthranilate synthase component I [Peribacillus frigoritolerans]|uniref:anthranilate synthase component I n=1 Tax=Peribacillus frigoritolerans TaxID=450367 RepID=UPI0010598436|nr:anthranilate synthase component I [Peribacillus frigoritolerans]TDL75034.1 anthranilate synthase component I [Peribacillus frigoritolerans]